MANNIKDFHLRFFANIDLGSFKKSIESIQSSIEKLNVSGTLKNEFNTLFNNLNKELNTFTNLANQEFNSLSDVKKLESSQKNIISLYNTLESKIDQINTKKLNPIFTNEQKSRIEEINKSIEENRKEIENTNNSYESLKNKVSTLDFGNGKINKAVLSLINAAQSGEQYSDILAKIRIDIGDATKAHGKYAQSIKDSNSKIKENQDEINNLTTKIKDAEKELKQIKSNNSILEPEQLEKLNSDIKKAEETLNSFVAKWKELGKGRLTNNSQLESFEDTYGVLKDRVAELKRIRGDNSTGNQVAGITNVNERVKELNETLTTSREKIKELKAENTQLSSSIDDIMKKQKSADLRKITEIVRQLESLGGSSKLSEEQIEKLNQELASIYSAGMDNVVKEFEKMQSEASNSKTTVEKVGSAVEDFGNQAQGVAKVNQQFEELYRKATYFFSINNAFNLFKKTIREAYNEIKELDAAMTDIAVVTDFNIGDVWETIPQYTDLSNELGTTILGAYETAKLYYQQGLDNNEVMEASRETLKMARIANMDYAEATDYMTAAVRGFKLEMTDASRVNDVFSKLAAISASDTQEIADALTRTASIANSAGMSLETTSAFLTQMIETTREAPKNF